MVGAAAAAGSASRRPIRLAFVLPAVLTVAGCHWSLLHGSGSRPDPASQPGPSGSSSGQGYSLSASISGLTASGLTLAVNGSNVAVAKGAAAVTLVQGLSSGGSYAVTVQAQPIGQACAVSGGTGTVGSADVTSVAVICGTEASGLGGTLSGLTAAGLVLANGNDSVELAAGATTFTMNPVDYDSAYDVTVRTNPPGEVCSVANGSGTMGSSPVDDVAVTCLLGIGGTISGLGAHTGLKLLNNGADSTVIAANATTFSMNTSVAEGAPYDITIGTQPYGISVACAVSGSSGTANTVVTSVAIDCTSVTPLQTEVTDVTYGTSALSDWGLNSPQRIAVDAAGDLFLADTHNGAVKEIPLVNGSYGAAIEIGTGFTTPTGIALDAAGNVFVTDLGTGAVSEIPFANGNYGPPVTIGPTFGAPQGVAVDGADDVFVADAAEPSIQELPFSKGSYGAPVSLGSGFTSPYGLTLDAADDVFVANTVGGSIEEIPYAGGSYGSPITISSGLTYPMSLAVGAEGNVFWVGYGGSALTEIPSSNGVYGAPITISSQRMPNTVGVAVDGQGRVYVLGQNYVWKFTP
jgi:hypothetical protein